MSSVGRAADGPRSDEVQGLGGLPVLDALMTRQTAPDHIASVVRDAVLTGVLREGQELNQVALAKHFNVSRVPVREALRQLLAEGLVRQEAHRRAVVSTLSNEAIMELFDLRLLLEGYLVERAVERLTDADLDELRAIIERMTTATDHQDWLQLNRTFHLSIYAASDASYTRDLVDQIMGRSTRQLWLRSGGTGVDRFRDANREHEELLDALVARDASKAVERLRVHVNGTRGMVQRLLERRDAERARTQGGPSTT